MKPTKVELQQLPVWQVDEQAAESTEKAEMDLPNKHRWMDMLNEDSASSVGTDSTQFFSSESSINAIATAKHELTASEETDYQSLPDEDLPAIHRWLNMLIEDAASSIEADATENFSSESSIGALATAKQELTELEDSLNETLDGVEKKLHGHDQTLEQHDQTLEEHKVTLEKHVHWFETLNAKVHFAYSMFQQARGQEQVFEGEMRNQVEAMRLQIDDLLTANAVNTDERQELMVRLHKVANELKQCRVTQVKSNLAQLTFVSYLGYRVHANTVWQWLFVACVCMCAIYLYYTRQRTGPLTELDLTTTNVTSRESDVIVGAFAGAFSSAVSYVGFWCLTQG